MSSVVRWLRSMLNPDQNQSGGGGDDRGGPPNFDHLGDGDISDNDDEEESVSYYSAEDLEWNGYQLSGVMIPEPILELIFSKVPTKDIKTVKKVCVAWNQITNRNSFWKLQFEYNKKPWSVIPNYIKEKNKGWIVMYLQAKNNIFSTNYIKNHSGSSGLQEWQIQKDGGNHVQIENPPVGCHPLPEDEMFPDSNMCFSTSFDWTIKIQRIDLWEYGLIPRNMKILLPFRIEISEKITARFDCGGKYFLEVTLDSCKERTRPLSFKRCSLRLAPTMEWQTKKINFVIRNKKSIKTLRYLTFRHGGCDTQFWAGNYGTKLAHAAVRIIPVGDEPYDPDSAIDDQDMVDEIEDEHLQHVPFNRRPL